MKPGAISEWKNHPKRKVKQSCVVDIQPMPGYTPM